jgi:hypothetical protein
MIRLPFMSITEILQELPRLSSEELDLVRSRLDQLQTENFEETPEILEAIEEGIRSANTEPGYTIEEIRAEIPTWFTKSS